MNLLARDFLFQPFVVGLQLLVFEIAASAVVFVGGEDQFVGGFGEDSEAEVDSLERVGLDGLGLAALRIEEHQGGAVDIVAFIGLQVDAFTILVKAVRRTGLRKYPAGIDFGELVGVDAEDLLIAIAGDPGRRGRSWPFRSKVQPAILSGVFTDQGLLTGGDLELVEMPCQALSHDR